MADSTPQGPLSVLMLSFPPGDDFYYTLEQAAIAEAERLGVDLEIQKLSSMDPSVQVSALDAGVAKQPDVILISPYDANALQSPIERAAGQGIKIISYDNTIADGEGVLSTWVSSDTVEEGRMAARALVDLIDGQGKVFYQGTSVGTAFYDAIRKGWTEVMDAEPGIEQLPPVYSDYEVAKANSQMEAILTANPDLAGGFASIFSDQQGIVPAIERAGKVGQLKVVGLDGQAANIENLKSGALQTLISLQPGGYGKAIIQAAVKAANGEELPPQIKIPMCVLTVETVDDPENAACIYQQGAAE
jgi:ribose transport system substrate-binding protein